MSRVAGHGRGGAASAINDGGLTPSLFLNSRLCGGWRCSAGVVATMHTTPSAVADGAHTKAHHGGGVVATRRQTRRPSSLRAHAQQASALVSAASLGRRGGRGCRQRGAGGRRGAAPCSAPRRQRALAEGATAADTRAASAGRSRHGRAHGDCTAGCARAGRGRRVVVGGKKNTTVERCGGACRIQTTRRVARCGRPRHTRGHAAAGRATEKTDGKDSGK